MTVYAHPRLLNAGEGGLVVEFADTVDRHANDAVRALDRAVRAAATPAAGTGHWLVGTVPTYRSLLVIFDPLRMSAERLREFLRAQGMQARLDLESGGRDVPDDGRDVVIPVCYQGELAPDLAEVAKMTGLDPADVIAIHTGAGYLVHMIGFLVGYPYMASVPERIRLPRLSRPRLRTPTGSVAIAGELTGIYPLPSPGGWRVLGTTPWPMYDSAWDPPALLQPGDRVRFRAIERAEFDRLAADPGIPANLFTRARTNGTLADRSAPLAATALSIVRPGLLTTVQDLGRPGYHRYGIGPGGAMDKFALRTGNRLLGNDEGAAALEVTGPGMTVEFLRPAEFVWAAPDGVVELEGLPVPAWTVIHAPAGARFTVNSSGFGLRGYLCLAGGIAAPRLLGSRSTSLATGFGGPFGRPCRAGDVLSVDIVEGGATPGRAADQAVVASVYERLRRTEVAIRVVPGLQEDMFGEEGLAVLFGSAYRVSNDSNRMGYRLEGPPVRSVAGHDIVSDGLIEGAIQVPGNGQPVLLGAEHQTTGGYPKPGVVAGADLPLFGQLSPGRELRLVRCDAHDALAARLQLEHAVSSACGDLRQFELAVDGRREMVQVDSIR